MLVRMGRRLRSNGEDLRRLLRLLLWELREGESPPSALPKTRGMKVLYRNEDGRAQRRLREEGESKSVMCN